MRRLYPNIWLCQIRICKKQRHNQHADCEQSYYYPINAAAADDKRQSGEDIEYAQSYPCRHTIQFFTSIGTALYCAAAVL